MRARKVDNQGPETRRKVGGHFTHAAVVVLGQGTSNAQGKKGEANFGKHLS